MIKSGHETRKIGFGVGASGKEIFIHAIWTTSASLSFIYYTLI